MAKVASIVRPYCQKVLPLTYDDSLSYYECILKLTDKCNEIIEQFDDWSDVIAELQQAITDIDTMKTDISNIKSELTTYESLTNERFDNLSVVINSLDDYVKALAKRVDTNEDSVSALTQVIAKLRTTLENEIKAVHDELVDLINSKYVDFEERLTMLQLKLNQMKVNLQSQIDDINERLAELETEVLNPWRTELGKIPLSKNIKYIYRDLADSVPTASEYCTCNLTATQYSAKDMTAFDYVQRGKKLLHLDWLFSPVFGWLQEANNVLTSIVDWLCDTITANVYAEMDLTADDYNNLNLTAQDYYKFNPERVGLFVQDGVLQSNQYILAEEDGVLSIIGGTVTETDGVLEIT